jgi:hypothetical protein
LIVLVIIAAAHNPKYRPEYLYYAPRDNEKYTKEYNEIYCSG